MIHIYSFIVIEVRSLKAPCPSETCKGGTFLSSASFGCLYDVKHYLAWGYSLPISFLSSYDLCVCVCVFLNPFSFVFSFFYKNTQRGLPGWISGRNLLANAGHGFDPWIGNIPWGRAAFLPKKSHRHKSLAGYSPKGHKESCTAEHIWHVCHT